MPWLVAGLGNPGDRYAFTRHNLGAMVVEEMARAAGARLRKTRFVPVDLAEVSEGDEQVLLARSHRFMNESGPSYASIAKKRHVDPDHVIAVYDELDIAPGAIRVKAGGGAGGHNGVRSLIQALGSPEFLRVRVGIGRPPGRQDPAEFVLDRIPARLETDIAIAVDRAADAVGRLISQGLAAAQDAHNGSGPTD